MEVKRLSLLVECRGAVVIDLLWSTAFTIVFVMTLSLAMEIMIAKVERVQALVNAPPTRWATHLHIGECAHVPVAFLTDTRTHHSIL